MTNDAIDGIYFKAKKKNIEDREITEVILLTECQIVSYTFIILIYHIR